MLIALAVGATLALPAQADENTAAQAVREQPGYVAPDAAEQAVQARSPETPPAADSNAPDPRARPTGEGKLGDDFTPGTSGSDGGPGARPAHTGNQAHKRGSDGGIGTAGGSDTGARR